MSDNLLEQKIPKKRGRKPKNPDSVVDNTIPKEPKIKKKPGRKPKNKDNIENIDGLTKIKKKLGRKPKNSENIDGVVKKKSGRKPKNKDNSITNDNAAIIEVKIKKKPGRKPLNKSIQNSSSKNSKYVSVRRFEIIIGNIILQSVVKTENDITDKQENQDSLQITSSKLSDLDVSNLTSVQEKIKLNLVKDLECSSYSPIQAAKIAFSNIYKASERYNCVYIFSLIEKTQENFNKLFTYMGTINNEQNNEAINSGSSDFEILQKILVVRSYNYKKNVLKEKNDSGNVNFINIDFNDNMEECNIKKIERKIIPQINYEK